MGIIIKAFLEDKSGRLRENVFPMK